MEYTYELLRKCNGLRFSCTIHGKHTEGIIKVNDSFISLCYGDIVPGNLVNAERRDYIYLDTDSELPDDFKIIVRDSNIYDDWQIGDKISVFEKIYIVIFRCGECVLIKTENDTALSTIYTNTELFRRGFRLILTDIEKKILKEQNPSEKKHTFKRYDAVLVRDARENCWEADIFIKYHAGFEFQYQCIRNIWAYCIPLTKDTEYLLDTNKPYKEKK